MRLIHVDTLVLKEFLDDNIPPYAILSHRWENDEVSYKDVLKRRNLDAAGWAKVRNFCGFIRGHERGLEYAWVDTCCIDKGSSAELSEAINSMFNWYRKAKVCYVYLNDVPEAAIGSTEQAELRKSLWFTRGWTLQELLAPKELHFVSSGWEKVLGSRRDLAEVITEITGIRSRLLTGYYISDISEYSIAHRMSWAAKRVCTRGEDLAYCLLGLFNINMPLLYGEGAEKAFIRLQQEIVKISDDESIFAWSITGETIPWRASLFAPSPSFFRGSENVVQREFIPRPEYALTHKGMKFESILGASYSQLTSVSLRPFSLNCCKTGAESKPIILILRKQGDTPKYRRVSTSQAGIARILSKMDQPAVEKLEVFYIEA